jgi:hypothetical protein
MRPRGLTLFYHKIWYHIDCWVNDQWLRFIDSASCGSFTPMRCYGLSVRFFRHACHETLLSSVVSLVWLHPFSCSLPTSCHPALSFLKFPTRRLTRRPVGLNLVLPSLGIHRHAQRVFLARDTNDIAPCITVDQGPDGLHPTLRSSSAQCTAPCTALPRGSMVFTCNNLVRKSVDKQ